MIHLFNGCYCSELKVNPKNWQSLKASLKKDWFIYYRFYDPSLKDQYPKGKLRIIKGMNKTKVLEQRQKAVKALMDLELNELKILHFNPIADRHIIPLCIHSAISKDTPFLQALQQAFARANYTGHTLSDIRSLLRYVEKAAFLLQIDYLPVKEINPSHMLLILEQCGKIKERWSANTYNTYIKYLSILFGQLLQYRAVEYNPLRDLKKKKVLRKTKEILTPEECNEIDRFIKEFDKGFWRFIHIFFHSGCRVTEILRVQGKDVNLKKQKVKYLVLKGQQPQYVERTIKDVALPLWEIMMQGCGENDYVFSAGLKPGKQSIRAEQISRRWRTHIKKKLGIDCDFYSLKHLNTDQTSALLGLEAAAAHNSHKSTAITKIYAVNEKERMHLKLKGVKNNFAK